jgi:hypothetical protein
MKKNKSHSEIKLYVHCSEYMMIKPPGISPGDFSHLEVGRTDRGILVRCIRHNADLIHYDMNWPLDCNGKCE